MYIEIITIAYDIIHKVLEVLDVTYLDPRVKGHFALHNHINYLGVMSVASGMNKLFHLNNSAKSIIKSLIIILQETITTHFKAYSKCHFMGLIDLISQ